MGRAVDRPEWLLQPYQVIEVVDTLAVAKNENPTKAHVTKGKILPSHRNITLGNNIGYFGPHEELLRSYPGIVSRVWNGCQAGRFTLGIESDGRIKGCPSLPTAPYIGGNIRDLTLEQIWNDTPELRFVRDRDTQGIMGALQNLLLCRNLSRWMFFYNTLFFWKTRKQSPVLLSCEQTEKTRT